MSRTTQDTSNLHKSYSYGIVTLSDPIFHYGSDSLYVRISRSYNPKNASTLLVWAPARSLATTCAITFVFFSYRY